MFTITTTNSHFLDFYVLFISTNIKGKSMEERKTKFAYCRSVPTIMNLCSLHSISLFPSAQDTRQGVTFNFQ